MKEEKFSERLKKTSGCIWWMLGGISFVCLLLILGGTLILLAVDDAAVGGIACIVVGALGLALFLGIGLLLPYIQWKKGITKEGVTQWSSGILNDSIIKKDIRKGKKSTVVGMFGTTAVILVIIIPIMLLSDEITMLQIMSLLCAGGTFVWGIKEWITINSELSYYIEEDRIIDSKTDTTFDIIDATTNHLPTKTPKFVFEKYGEYAINSMQTHAYYPPQALIEDVKIGEEVYLVKSRKTNKILHIYRKKYWSK